MTRLAALLLVGCVTRAELDRALDRDGDGYLPVVAGGPDCDETRSDVHPGAEEICGDDIDNDCDGRIDDRGIGERIWYLDADGDGHGVAITTAACTEPEGYAPVEGDCDDGDPSIQPGAEDLCDGVDQDCDGLVDDDAADLNQFRDADGDGFGTDTNVVIGCGLTPGYVLAPGDCDDTEPDVNPASQDVCDGIDQDCNGQIDDDVTFFQQFRDADGDGDGDPFDSHVACENLAGFVLTNTDCDDADPSRSGQAIDFCDGFDQDCDGVPDNDATFQLYYVDHDGDGVGTGAAALDACSPVPGFATITGDCDDHDFDINPLVEDDCDGVDSDCDGQADDDALLTLYFPDQDGDGIGSTDPGGAVQACIPPAGHVQLTGDCDDDDPTVSPAAVDLCDGLDQDCDGAIDDDADFVLLYPDLDGDGVGAGDPELRCDNPGGLVAIGGDCDDSVAAIRPGVPDDCNGVDDDCDGIVDDEATFELLWSDTDGDGAGSGAPVLTCDTPADHAPVGGDCDDTDPSVNPAAIDLCDGEDQDCDGAIDDDASFSLLYLDHDGDGVGAGDPELRCDNPGGWVAHGGDCDDSTAAIRPGLPDGCNGVDDDCDGVVDDEATFALLWPDHDDDGVGDGVAVLTCANPPNHAPINGDCEDDDPGIRPGLTDLCDTVDQDCDGAVDEDATFSVWFPDLDGDGAGANGAAVSTCDGPPPLHVDIAGDCDDADPTVVIPLWWADGDGDGYGAGAPVAQCDAPLGRVDNDGDCDDGRAATAPNRPEVCMNFHDDDCSAATACRLPTFLDIAGADETFTHAGTFLVGVAGDLDGDGLPDLVRYGTPDAAVFLNTGSGFDFDVPNWERAHSRCTPIHQDGWGGTSPDLVCLHEDVAEVALWSFDPAPSSVVRVTQVPSGASFAFRKTPVGDVLEVEGRWFPTNSTTSYNSPTVTLQPPLAFAATSDCDVGESMCIVVTDGSGGFGMLEPQLLHAYGPSDLQWILPGSPIVNRTNNLQHDYTSDGIPDLIVMTEQASPQGPRPVVNVAQGALSPQTAPVVSEVLAFPPNSPAVFFPIPDADRDGVPDWFAIDNLLIGPGLTDTVTSLDLNYGGTTAPYLDGPTTTVFSLDYDGLFPLIGNPTWDWNGDGYDDILVQAIDVTTNTIDVAIFYGTGQ